jgi:2-dehydro-3-deoxy-D-arabinonate dehydratase
MLLYRTAQGPVVNRDDRWFAIDREWEDIVNDDDLPHTLAELIVHRQPDATLAETCRTPLAPIGERQELWAAGVTYYRSRTARMDESQEAGGGSFYDRVYVAERPEIFFKATPHRIVGPGQAMHLRRDSAWIVPEPELVLVVTRAGKIIGYTAGNDLSCRDIEGENPLYLPQAKTFDRCAALGPAILVADVSPVAETNIQLVIRRGDQIVIEDRTILAQLKRSPQELVDFLFRENVHPRGCC